MVTLFTGPAPIAEMVRDELKEHGVMAALRAEDPLGQVLGSAAAPAGLESVVVSAEEAERHRTVIEEVLAMVSDAEIEAEPDQEEPGTG